MGRMRLKERRKSGVLSLHYKFTHNYQSGPSTGYPTPDYRYTENLARFTRDGRRCGLVSVMSFPYTNVTATVQSAASWSVADLCESEAARTVSVSVFLMTTLSPSVPKPETVSRKMAEN